MLKNDIKELAKKVGRDQKLKKVSRKVKTEPIAQNCPVMIEDAGVFVV